MITIDQIVPGGILPTDHVHNKIHDNTCSRCRWAVPHGEVPILLWLKKDEDLLIYCQTCLDIPPPEGSANG